MRAVAATILVLALTSTAAAQQRDPRLERLDPSIRDSVAVLLDSTRSAGLPTNPLLEKALEGTTKGAAPVTILAAVRRLGAELATARAALGPLASPAELDAGASALHAGAHVGDLASLRQRRPRQSLVVALAVLSDLVARGVPADSAAAAVLALAGLARDEDYVAFRRNVEHDIALGAPPAAAAAIRLSATARALGASQGGVSTELRKP